MKTISPEALAARIASQSGSLLLDVRTPAEFERIHAPNSVNIPLDEMDSKTLSAAGAGSPNKPVYLLCQTGNRATRAASSLITSGYTDVHVVDGGIVAWEAAGLPVLRASNSVISLERQVRIAAGSLVLTGVLLGWKVHPGFFGLSGFVGAGLIFAGITDFCGMGLLLARLPYNKRGRTESCSTGTAV